MRIRAMLSPAWLALLLGLGLLVWLALGDSRHFRDTPPASAAETPAAEAPRVEVRLSRAEPHVPQVILEGQLEPRRRVVLRARRAGRVEALPHAQGDRVAAGDRLATLDAGDLPARLEQGRADLALARAELEGARQLRGRELVSNNELLRLQSKLAGSQATLATLEEALADTRIDAPFSGTLERFDIDPGAYVQVGESLGRLVDVGHLKATAWLPQQRAGDIAVGMPVHLTLLDGRQLTGHVSFVASEADEATRRFALEASVPNPEDWRVAGASATLTIPLPSRPAHRLSPARLVLDDQGRLGVKVVDADDRVRFRPVELISADAEHAWVGGLPDPVRLITLGGGFVKAGQRVTPVRADSPEGS
ncbi:efflux RND transporter periplasmic adaptor subunit [Modicisalibacter tunisiensis]|uniref:efflux RND transporter periplasmic adaptor subunit n=1 Tax=Modicisalibacter tunisiensis TaxID=390637 RepID=UPI001CCFB85A|nr:efflux RND transporter periplasmic adaptor subunit [Modicisalibacter tunisiensis]MBZ9538720.1 efflux RND transporter periplasmic adaptor subunit [Modicisalibacter tunisiensis]